MSAQMLAAASKDVLVTGNAVATVKKSSLVLSGQYVVDSGNFGEHYYILFINFSDLYMHIICNFVWRTSEANLSKC